MAKQLGALISGSGVNALAMAERGVAAALGAAEFNQLGHGSLLEFIGASSSLASLAQRAAGSGNGVGFAGAAILSLEELAGQVRQPQPLLTTPPLSIIPGNSLLGTCTAYFCWAPF